MTIHAIHADPTVTPKGVGSFEMEGYVSIVADSRQPIAIDIPAAIGIFDTQDWYVTHIRFDRNRRDLPAVTITASDGGWLWDHIQYDHRVIERAIWRRRQEQEERDV